MTQFITVTNTSNFTGEDLLVSEGATKDGRTHRVRLKVGEKFIFNIGHKALDISIESDTQDKNEPIYDTIDGEQVQVFPVAYTGLEPIE